jgi:ABC-type sugar transport system substrate-binding protein
MNSKEKKALNLKMLTKRVQRDLIDRRSFIKGSVALGLTASTAMLLYDSFKHVPAGMGTALAQDRLVRRLWPLDDILLDTYENWVRTDGKSFINISRSAAHPYHMHQDAVWREGCEEAGMDYVSVDSALDPGKEVENLELAISGRSHVIMGGPVDPASASPATKQARQDGRIIVNYDTDSIQRPTLKFGKIVYDDGFLAGQWMGENLRAGSTVIGAVGELVSSAGNDRKAGFLDGIAPFDIEVVSFEEGHGWSEEGGYTLGRTMLQKFAEVQGAFFGNDQASIGFERAARELGRRDGMLIVGNDGLREGQEAVADGRLDMSVMALWGHGPEALIAMDLVFAYVRGNLHGDAMESMHRTEVVAVTKENLAEQWQSPV